VLFAVAALAALVGSFLEWAIVPAPGGNLIRRTALHGDGALTAACAGAGLLLGLFCALKPARKAQLFGMLCLGGATLWISATVLSRFPPDWARGVGLWLTLSGGAAMVVATVWFTWALQRAPAETSGGPLPVIRE
jgi:hypothetical protein